MEEKSRAQELSVREISLIRELTQIRKEHPLTGEMKKKQMKFFPDAYKNRIGKSYNDYIADHQMNMFEDFIGYQSSTVLDEPEREAGTTSIPIPQREESENGQIYAEKFTSASLICKAFYGKMEAQ